MNRLPLVFGSARQRGVALFLLALILPGGSEASTYYFSTSGDDSRDGLTPETAIRSLHRVPDLLQPGVTVLLRRGDSWPAPGLDWDLRTRKSDTDESMTIGAYGDVVAPRPVIIDGWNPEPKDWVAVDQRTRSLDLGVVAKSAASIHVQRDGAALRRVASIAALRSDAFCLVDGRLHLMKQALGQGQAIEIAIERTTPLIRVHQSCRLVLRDLELKGGVGFRALQSWAPTAHVQIERVAVSNFRARSPVTPEGSMSTTTYYFSTSGSDANDGLSTGAPKKSLSLVPGLLGQGVTILFKRGDVWYEPSLYWNFTNKSGTQSEPMVLGAYGDTSHAKPVISDLVKNLKAEWQSLGSDKYRVMQRDTSTSNDMVFRLYLGGTPLHKVASEGSLVDSSYCVSSKWIYVKASTFNSHDFIETLQYHGSAVLYGTNTHHLRVEDLEFRGIAQSSVLLFFTPSSHLELRRLRLRQFVAYGISLNRLSSTDTTNTHEDVAITDCDIDRSWTSKMNTEYAHYVNGNVANGTGGAIPGGDGIFLGRSVDGCEISRCSITNMGHSGIGNEGGDLHTIGTRDVLIEANTITRGASSYCRAFSMSGDANRCANVVIRGNHFYDLNVASQFGGYRNYLYANIFDTTNESTASSDTRTPYCITALIGTVAAGKFVMKECVIANNTLVAADVIIRYAPLRTDTSHVRDNTIVNNLLVDWRSTSYSYYGHAVAMPDSMEARVTFTKNGFWRDSPDSAIYHNNASGDPSHTLPTFNTKGANSGNLEADPLFTGGAGFTISEFGLTSSSPFRYSGTRLSTLLPSGADTTDFNGLPFATTPSLGAIQYPWVALTSVSIAGAPTETIEPGTLVSAYSVLSPSNADIATYAWTIKKGGITVQTGSASSIDHTSGSTGTYTINLVVTDRLGNVRTATPVNFSVQNIDP